MQCRSKFTLQIMAVFIYEKKTSLEARSSSERESTECKQTEHDEDTLQVIENTYVIEENSSQVSFNKVRRILLSFW